MGHSEYRPRWALLYRWPWLLPLVGVTITELCLAFAFPVRVANDLDSLLHGDPAYLVYRDFIEHLGTDESVVVFFPCGGLTRESVLDLFDLTTLLGRQPWVRRTASMTDLLPDEACGSRPELQRWLERPLSLSHLASSCARTRLARGRLASREFSHLSVVVRLNAPVGGGAAGQEARREALTRLHETVCRHFRGRPHHLLGYPIVEERVLELVKTSNTILVPLATLVGSAVLLMVFRSLLFLVVAMGSILSALVWTLAAFRLRDYTLNPFSTMLFPLLLTVGLTTTIYVLTAYLAHARTRRPGRWDDPELAVLPEVAPPTFMCTVTTFIGFLSLAWTDVPEIRNFGIYDAVGTVFCLVAIFLFIPPLLKMFGARWLPAPAAANQPRAHDVVGLAVARLVRLVFAHRPLVAVGFCLLVATSLEGLRRLPVESASIGGLYDDDPVIEAKRLYSRLFEPIFSLQLLIRLPARRSFLDLEGQRTLTGLQERLRRVPGVVSSLSVADVLLDVSSFISKKEKLDIPTERELSLLTRFLDSEPRRGLMDAFLTDSDRLARMQLTVDREGSLAILDCADRVRRAAEAFLPAGSSVQITGRHLLSAMTHRDTMVNEVTSFAMSLAAILTVIAVIFRSVGVALVAAVPNLLPLAMTYGTMGWLGVPFNIATGMIPCILIGLVVDDTIHYLFRYREHRLRSSRPVLALGKTARQVGRAVVSTALILSAGILVLAFSRFKMIVQFGLFTGLAVSYGLVTELVFTPALFMLFPGLLAPAARPVRGARVDDPGGPPRCAETPSR
ncbi:MAG: MMPL family transporter [Candidatus Riflebacteria bacterium]|nr:MMPL family transporter [Candidatus Riflebacteria bacterium]